MKRVLVLDANQRSALATTRSLGQQGITVFTCDDTLDSLAGASRFSHVYLRLPSPETEAESFVDAVLTAVQQHNIEIVIPMTELTTELLLSNSSLSDYCSLPLAPLSTIERLANKCELMKLAATLDMPHPASRQIEPKDDVHALLESANYPLVLKPGKSWNKNGNQWARAAVRIAKDFETATSQIHQEAALQLHPFMLQQFIPGHGAGIFALYDRGKPVAFFAHHRIREKPPSGGVSVLSESVQANEEMLAYSKKLLDEVNWHGVAMIEFRVADNGTPYLMEVNTRLWGSLQLAIDAGVDFPWLLYQLADGQHPDPVPDYRKGLRLRWLLGDLDNLYLNLRDPQLDLAGKLNAVTSFVSPSLKPTRHETNRWGDMRPFWYELKRYFHDLLQ